MKLHYLDNLVGKHLSIYATTEIHCRFRRENTSANLA